MEIVFQVFSIDVTQIRRNRRLLRLPFLFHLLQDLLDLFSSPLFLVGSDQFVSFLEVFFFSQIQIHSQALIIFRHLFSQVAASGVDHQILGPVGRFIDLDEVVAAAQRT